MYSSHHQNDPQRIMATALRSYDRLSLWPQIAQHHFHPADFEVGRSGESWQEIAPVNQGHSISSIIPA